MKFTFIFIIAFIALFDKAECGEYRKCNNGIGVYFELSPRDFDHHIANSVLTNLKKMNPMVVFTALPPIDEITPQEVDLYVGLLKEIKNSIDTEIIIRAPISSYNIDEINKFLTHKIVLYGLFDGVLFDARELDFDFNNLIKLSKKDKTAFDREGFQFNHYMNMVTQLTRKRFKKWSCSIDFKDPFYDKHSCLDIKYCFDAYQYFKKDENLFHAKRVECEIVTSENSLFDPWPEKACLYYVTAARARSKLPVFRLSGKNPAQENQISECIRTLFDNYNDGLNNTVEGPFDNEAMNNGAVSLKNEKFVYFFSFYEGDEAKVIVPNLSPVKFCCAYDMTENKPIKYKKLFFSSDIKLKLPATSKGKYHVIRFTIK